MSGSRKLVILLAAVVGALGLAQLVPYERDRSNPPDGQAVAFDSQATESLARRACYDCHSNRTRWPWYSSLAPMSWRIQNHVREGREALNFTAFDPASEKVAEAAGEASETIVKGEMPPRDYLLLHPEARLTAAEKRALAKGLATTLAPFAKEESRAAREPSRGANGGTESRESEERD